MAGAEGFEPPTSGIGIRCSTGLSYTPYSGPGGWSRTTISASTAQGSALELRQVGRKGRNRTAYAGIFNATLYQ